MILVEPEMLEKLQHFRSTESTTLNILDEDMKKVLNNTSIGDRDKWNMYHQVLQRYLHVVNESRKPLTIPIVENKTDDDIHEENNDADILDSVPKSLQTKASLLIQKLKKDGSIKWNDRGTVYVDGVEIEKSNITDLLNDVIRTRKGPGPNGWKIFATALGKINMPFELIGNADRRDYIMNPQPDTPPVGSASSSGRSSMSNYGTDDIRQTSSTRARRRSTQNKSKKKIEWESFQL